MHANRLIAIAVVYALTGCGGSNGSATGDGGADAGAVDSTANPDTGGARDSSADVMNDRGAMDAGVDQAADASASPEAGSDAGPDADAAPADASAEGASDASIPMGDGAAPPQGVVSASPLTAFEAETEVAVAADGTTAISWTGDPDPFSTAGQLIGYTFWTPGSATWTPVQTITHNPTDYSTDSSVITDSAGNILLTWLGNGTDPTTGNFISTHVWCAHAPKGTTTFSSPVLVSDPAVDATAFVDDKPWPARTHAGTILVSYTVATTTTNGIVVARSIDGGMTWSHAPVPNTDNAGVGYICPPATGGRVYMVDVNGQVDKGRPRAHALELSPSPWVPEGGTDAADDGASDGGEPTNIIELRWSDDDGASWPGSNLVLTSDAPFISSCASLGPDVWVDYINSTSVRVAHFDSMGTALVSDDPVLTVGTEVFHNDQLVLRESGALDDVFFFGTSIGDTNASLRHSASLDQGVTWSPSTSVYAPELFTLVRHRPQWLGDYVGMRSFGGSVYLSYPRNEGPDQRSHVAFTILP